MTRIRRSEDLVAAILDLRRAGELLAHPCACTARPDKPHMLGDHLFQSTKDMRPGIRASAAALTAGGTGDDLEPTAEPTDPHDQLCTLVGRGQDAARDLIGFIERHRPDRGATISHTSPASDDDWCRACLAAGYCTPRFRDESLCRWCVEYRLAWRIEPPADIVTLRHTGQGRKLTVGQIQASNKAERKRLNAEKRKAKTA